MTIERVRTRAQLTRFITLPRHLYEGMAGYVAPLDLERRELLDPRKSPFFTHGYAAYWIASRDGRPVGRISAQIDLAAEGPDAGDIGMFGCLDAVDDGEIVGGLLATAENWLRRHGRRIARGPFLLSINGEAGLLIEGQSQAPMTLLPWHPAYLDRHVRDAGYGPATTLLCFDCKNDEFAFDERLQGLAKVRSRMDVVVRDIRLDNLDADMEVGRRIFNDGWQRNWGFTPATEPDVHTLITQFRPFLFPDSGFFVEVRGEPAAFMLAIPNVFEITSDLGAAPRILGWAKLLFKIWRQRYRSFRIILLGIASAYHGSPVGAAVATIVFEEVRRRLRARRADCCLAWILESNRPALKAVKELGFRQTRTYGVYEKRLVD